MQPIITAYEVKARSNSLLTIHDNVPFIPRTIDGINHV